MLKGNKPDFHLAMSTNEAQQFYNEFLDAIRKQYKDDKIKGWMSLIYLRFFVYEYFNNVHTANYS